MAENDILSGARRLAEAKVAIDLALAQLVAQLPEDQQAEFGESDVEGFQFNLGGVQRAQIGGLAKLPGSSAFFDTNGVCGAGADAFASKLNPAIGG